MSGMLSNIWRVPDIRRKLIFTLAYACGVQAWNVYSSPEYQQ